jgi:hypothetical protein
MDLNLSFIMLNILLPTSDISCITNCNCSYQHVNLFHEFDDNFGKFNNDHWTNMFNVKCMVISSKMNAILHVDAMNKTLIKM